MALRKVGTPYTALRAASRLPPVEPPAERLIEALQASAVEPAPEPVALAAGPAAPDAPAAPEARRPRKTQADPAEGSSRKTSDRRPASAHFRLRVPYPARGTCAEFEQIAAAYDEEVAIQTVFKRAFDAWVKDFRPTRAARLDTEYARGEQIFATSRIIRSEIIEAVSRAIDPLGIRTKTYIAERIALAAMKAYIASP
jgi:hypothetical protein